MENVRNKNESLHAYLTRKGITCGCRRCRRERFMKNNAELLQYEKSISFFMDCMFGGFYDPFLQSPISLWSDNITYLCLMVFTMDNYVTYMEEGFQKVP